MGNIFDARHPWFDTSSTDASDYDLHDFLQIAVVDRRSTAALESGYACKFSRRRNGRRIRNGSARDDRCALDILLQNICTRIDKTDLGEENDEQHGDQPCFFTRAN